MDNNIDHGYGIEVDDNATEPKSVKEPRLKDIFLPDGLYRRVMKQYALAIVFVIISIVLCIVNTEPVYLCGFIVSGVLTYLGISTTLDFANGKIVEIPVICASVNTVAMRKITRVVFRSNDDFPTYYEFLIPGKADTRINPNYAYIIYFNPDVPRELLGYTPI